VETTLGEVCIFNYGKGLKTETRISGNIPVYGSSGITGWHNEALIKEKGLIIGRKGSVGTIYKSEVPFYPIDTVFYITQKDTKCDLEYLYRLLQSLGLDKKNSDSAVPGLNRENAYSTEILLPSFPEQQAIASVLSAFDDKIELLREQNKTLEEIGQTIFQEWFGKYSVDRPEDLPEGWRVGKLGDENFAGIIGSGINEFDGEKIYLATADVSNSNIINTNKRITFQERPSRANMQPIEKSIWFAKMQDSRKLLMFDDYSEFEIENFILSTGFAGIKTTEISHYFMWCFILSKEFNELKNNMANGAVQIAVNNLNLEKIEFIVPDNETLIKFNELVKPIFQKIYVNNSQIQSLTRTRDELLPKLISGIVRVSDFNKK